MVSIDLTGMVSEVQRAATAAAKLRLEQAALGHIQAMFYEGRPYRDGKGNIVRDRGILSQLLIEKIEAYALSDEFEGEIQQSIQRHMPVEADKAVQGMLNSASRKRVFSAVPHE